MPRPSQEEKLLAAALACFAEVGYDATRIRSIAERAGMSEGALYRHYPSKEAIAQSLYSYHLRNFSERLLEVAASSGTAEVQLREIVAATLRSYRENPAAFTFVLLRQSTLMPSLPHGTVYPLDVIERMVAAWQQGGTIRRGQPNLLAAIVLGCVLRPIIVSQLAQPGALDLLHDRQHDLVISDAAWAALRAHAASSTET
ncbi:MAG: TetR/AcrR family transcriptional regulator [Roseiflexaceae bacterium]|nr:TetR/AcrR family transcriptional regulator [Roseiflexaceae bacterium]